MNEKNIDQATDGNEKKKYKNPFNGQWTSKEKYDVLKTQFDEMQTEKSKSLTSMEKPSEQSSPTPSEPNGMLKMAIEGLIASTRVDPTLLEGMNDESKVAFLKNYASQKSSLPRTSPNTNIVPNPTGTSGRQKLGVEKYMTEFDPKRQRIEFRIPGSVALDPEKNKLLGEPL